MRPGGVFGGGGDPVVPGGVDASVQFNDGGEFGGMVAMSHNAGYPSLSEGAPTTGASGQVTLGCVQRAGKRHLVVGDGYVSSWARDIGGAKIMGTHPCHARWQWYRPYGNSDTTVSATFGVSIQGTQGAPALATTSMVAMTCRIQQTSSTTAGNFASVYEGAARMWRGNVAGLGGFYTSFTFAPEDAAAVAGARMFVGLHTAVAGATNVEPNTLTNIIGTCQLSTSNNLHLIHNDGSGTATTVDLGANFPANGNTALYRLTLWCIPNGSDIGYRIERLDTGNFSEGLLSSDLPTSTSLLARRAWRCNNATALAVKLSIAEIVTELET